MKIKIKDKIYDSNIEPLMLIFDNTKERIIMGNRLVDLPAKDDKYVETSTKYCMYPDNINKEVIEEFMKIK
jgi:hypothetical protein